jgi:hypothetical protein
MPSVHIPDIGAAGKGLGIRLRKSIMRSPTPRPMPTKASPGFAGSGIVGGAALMSNMAFGTGVGAITGGLYTSDGLSLEGGLRGAMGGAFVGGLAGAGLPAASFGLIKSAAVRGRMQKAGFSRNAIQMTKHLASNEGRRTLFAGGGLLGGAIFGGGDSKRRGFNANRGTHIGHS